MTPVNYLLWAAPVLLLLLGTFLGLRFIRKHAAQTDADSPEAGQS
jgi:cytochrome c-type biogenesis protein CcmH/NrfF